jgi:phospholipid transport system substrate-binding protein
VKKLLVLVTPWLLVVITWSLACSAQASVTPSTVVTELYSTVKQMKKEEPDKNIILTAADVKRNTELGQRVDRLLDIEGISAYALWQHWNSRGAQDRRNFVSTFTEVLEKVAYVNTSKFLQDLEVSVHKEKVVSDKAMVYTSIVHEKEGRVDIDFKLHQAGDSWVVEDVFLDGVSLARNLRTQCQKIIRENSFQELLARMRKKINEKDTEDLKEVTGRDF